MTDTIALCHPGPLLHVPPRCRDSRLSYARMVTPVRLRSLSLLDTDEGPSVLVAGGTRIRTRLIDGEPWRPVGRDRLDRITAKAPDEAAFRSWLAGFAPEGPFDPATTLRTFAATPLVARHPEGYRTIRPDAAAAGPPEGRIVVDLRDLCRTYARDFVEGEVAIVAGQPMTRMRGPLAFADGQTPSALLSVAAHPGRPAVEDRIDAGIFFRVDRAWDQYRALHDRPSHEQWTRRDYEGVSFRRDDDVLVTGLEGIRRVARIGRTPELHPGDPLPKGLGARMVALSVAATIGAFGEDELMPAYETLADACRVHGARPWGGNSDTRNFLAYATRIALPLLRARQPGEADDLNALGALAP